MAASAEGRERRLPGSRRLDHEEPLCTSGFFGCKPTLANFSQEEHLQEGDACKQQEP